MAELRLAAGCLHAQMIGADEHPSHRGRTRRSPRTTLVFALPAVAVVTMLVFEATTTPVIGVPALFGFVVAAAFALADHEFLDPDSESAHDDAAAAGTRPAQER